MSKVTVRFVEEKDAPFVQKFASESQVAMTCLLPNPYPENGGKEWVDFAINSRKAKKSYSFSILFDGEFAGVISLIGLDKENKSCNVGYWLGTPYWNKGICTNAISEVIDFGFNKLGLKDIWAECLKENLPSIKVLEKNSFLEDREFTFDAGKFKGEKGIWYVLKKE